RSGPGPQRPAAQSVRRLPVQRPHGAASGADAGVSTLALVRDPGVGRAAAAPAGVGVSPGAPDDAPARRRGAVRGADHPVALPAILRGGARASPAAHRAAPRVPGDGRGDVVAGALALA